MDNHEAKDRTKLKLIIGGTMIIATIASYIASKNVKKKGKMSKVDQALLTAKIEGAHKLEQLRKAGVIGLKRPVKIRATPLSSESKGEKIVHIVRHGQGFHNLMADIYREHGKTWTSFASQPSEIENNPYCLPALLDPPLTENGRNEAKALCERTKQTSIQLVVTSPLRRAIQTGILACPHLYNDGKTRWVANELVRETMGVHSCDKRKTISEKKRDFPYIDFSCIKEDEDKLWRANHRESALECSNRLYEFTLWLRKQPEKELLIAGHSSALFSLMNTVFEASSDELKTWLLTGEMRSMYITFEDEQS